jgi:hypothetical protein
VTTLRPTVPPPGRLVRLGVVLDPRNPAGRLVEIGGMCDRVGIGALWSGEWRVLELLVPVVGRAHLGLVLGTGAGLGEALAAADHLEITRRAAVERLEVTVRDAAASSLEAVREAVGSRSSPRLAVEVADDREVAAWLEVVDDVLLAAGSVDQVAGAALALRQMAAGVGRDPASLGIAARLPVSVGRTATEARARWEAEPAFAALGPPQDAAVFGTLEQCHERVIALAHAGVTDLRCVLPNTADVHDVIAQLTAMTVGTVDKLVPGAPRSPAPPPPPGWGGRPRFPTGSPSPRR